MTTDSRTHDEESTWQDHMT